MVQKKAFDNEEETYIVEEKDKLNVLRKHLNQLANALVDNGDLTVEQINAASHSQWPGD